MFKVPRRLGILVIVGLALLAVAGATDSIGDALRDEYFTQCQETGLRPFEERTDNGTTNETGYEPPTAQEREECRAARLPVTIVDALRRAALAPGIAIVAISAVYLIALAIAARKA